MNPQDTTASYPDAGPVPQAVAESRPGPPLDLRLLAGFVVAKLTLHLAAIAITPYSVHRDELLYLAMGRYLRFFAMDFPPFIAVAANTARFLFGDTLFAIRILPALAGTLLLVLCALIVRELGGGRLAQGTALLAMLLSPLFLRSAALFQPVVFDQLWWSLALLALLRIGRRGAPRDWYLLGAAGGLGLLTKFSIGFIAVGVAVALSATRERRWLRTRWPYVAAGIALLIGCASLIGQLRLGFPVAGQMQDLQAVQLERVTPVAFLTGQAMMLGPAVLLALAGLLLLLSPRSPAEFRAAGVAAIVPFLLLLALQGKAYYAGPLYPLLLGAGAVMLERTPRFRPALAATLTSLIVAFGVLTLPLGLPVLPPERMARYAASLGLASAVRTNTGVVLRLPQDYADMLGWEALVAGVADVYHELPPADRERAVIGASNYGEAGAIDFFGPRHGLPRAVSAVGSYWFFGPGDLPGEVVISVGDEVEDLGPFFDEFTIVKRVENPWGVPEQRNTPIGIGRRPHMTLQELWPSLAGRN
jgi:hypothetical protein